MTCYSNVSAGDKAEGSRVESTLDYRVEKKKKLKVRGVAQLVECLPTTREVMGFAPTKLLGFTHL